jgi:predicted metal-dependent phosphoesterase TrpH
MLLELHLHTSRHSPCSQLSPVDAVRRVVAKGLQGLVITEHHYLWTADELAALRAEAELDEGFVLLAGQEVDTDVGHVLVYGVEHTLAEWVRLRELRERYPAAALVWAHPFRYDRVPSDQALRNPLLDAVELFNTNHTVRGNTCALTAWHRLKFTATGGSDAHAVEAAGVFPTQLDHPVESMAELVEEIRRGRCRPFFKEIPHAGSNLAVTEIVIGTKGEDETRQRVVVKRFRNDRKWRQQKRALKTIDALLGRGFATATFRVPRILEVNDAGRVLIEEGQRGKLLFDLLRTVSPEVGERYFELAARWLASMHRLGMRVGRIADAVGRERRRFRSYRDAFVSTRNPHRVEAERILAAVEAREEQLFRDQAEQLVQVHGDYHPKNIIIGQDRAHDVGTVFVSVIDFANAMLFLPAFDVGYFLAQFRYQFREHPALLDRHGRERFLATYSAGLARIPDDLEEQVAFFEARANMSIASFLIKVGKGESGDLVALVERSLALLGL